MTQLITGISSRQSIFHFFMRRNQLEKSESMRRYIWLLNNIFCSLHYILLVAGDWEQTMKGENSSFLVTIWVLKSPEKGHFCRMWMGGPFWVSSHQRRGTFAVCERESKVIGEGAHLLYAFWRTILVSAMNSWRWFCCVEVEISAVSCMEYINGGLQHSRLFLW